MSSKSTPHSQNGSTRRPIRVGSASGAWMDPGRKMLEAALSDVDAIIADSLAELNIGQNATKVRAGEHSGYEQNVWDGFNQSLEVLNEKRIKVVVNGGAMRPRALAEEVQRMVNERKLDLKVAYTSGDDLYDQATTLLKSNMTHLDSANINVKLAKNTDNFLDDPNKPITSANAYCGARAIVEGLRQGADIVICGRVSDASLTIGVAWWWHNFKDTDYDELASLLIAGHLIECSAYTTGGNFSGFHRYKTQDLVEIAYPIAEIDSKGQVIITKADRLAGFVTADIVKTQLLYEIQGEMYLNSDVKADLRSMEIIDQGKNRVLVRGVKGHPPPPTTKLAVFYQAGYTAEFTIYACGLHTEAKFDLQEAQIRRCLEDWGIMDDFDELEFSRCGVPEINPRSQLAATTGMRVFAQSGKSQSVEKVVAALKEIWMMHFPGMHASFDFRTAAPLPFIGYYPALVEQEKLKETVTVLGNKGAQDQTFDAGHPSRYEPLELRNDYDTENPADLSSFGQTVTRPLGDLCEGRSGDKGANINAGFYVHKDEEYRWLKTYLSKQRMQDLIGPIDWKPEYWLERVELPGLKAVHFVWYGPLGRGTTSTARVDNLGKSFAEYIRAKFVEMPVKFLSA